MSDAPEQGGLRRERYCLLKRLKLDSSSGIVFQSTLLKERDPGGIHSGC
jgi:hypothetical protein